jgi:hypothetical protein
MTDLLDKSAVERGLRAVFQEILWSEEYGDSEFNRSCRVDNGDMSRLVEVFAKAVAEVNRE